MYWLFANRGWEPSRFLALPPGERAVVNAMVEFEISLRKKEADALRDKLR